VLGVGTTHRADSAERRQSDLQSSRQRHICVTGSLGHWKNTKGAVCSPFVPSDMSWGLTQRQ
jgi:hypothetical protein